MDQTFETRPADCERHGQFEQREIRILGRHITWTQCPKCVAEEDERAAAQAKREEAERRQAMAEARLHSAGVPTRFITKTLASYVADTPDKTKVRDAMARFSATFADQLARGTSVVLSGNPGTGKSHLAIGVLQEVMARGWTGMYLSVMDMVRMVRDTWRRDSPRSETEVLDILAGLDLLVLDEVGVQYGTDGEQVILFSVLDRRYRDARPTILLTNLASDDFAGFVGPRIADRLREGGAWLRLDWESHRGRK